MVVVSAHFDILQDYWSYTLSTLFDQFSTTGQHGEGKSYVPILKIAHLCVVRT